MSVILIVGLAMGVFISMVALVYTLCEILENNDGINVGLGALAVVAGTILAVNSTTAYYYTSPSYEIQKNCEERGFHHILRGSDGDWYCYRLPYEVNGGVLVAAEGE